MSGARLNGEPTEHEVQTQIVDALRRAGFELYESTAFRQKGPSGVDKAIPDILIPIPGHTFAYIGIEVKRPGTPRWSSPEQKRAFESRHFALAQCLEHVREALNKVRLSIPASNEFDAAYRRFHSICIQVKR